MGSLFAGLLAMIAPEYNDDICLLGGKNSRTSLALIGQSGLKIDVPLSLATGWSFIRTTPLGDNLTITVKNIHLAGDISDISASQDLALVLVKSYQTARAAHQLSSLLNRDGLAVTLQNGLGNSEQLAEVLGQQRVSQGSTSMGATLLSPGRVQLAGIGSTVLAAPNSNQQQLINGLVERLGRLQLPVSLEQEVKGLVWGKLVINCAINPLTALLNCANGALLKNSSAAALMDEAAQEAALVATDSGIKLPYPVSEAALRARQVAGQTSANISSMLVDVRRQSETEIEVINGAVVRCARSLEIPVPVNTTLYRLVKALTARNTVTFRY